MGLVFAPMSTSVLANMRAEDHAKASGTDSTLREIGVALGVAVLTTTVTLFAWQVSDLRKVARNGFVFTRSPSAISRPTRNSRSTTS